MTRLTLRTNLTLAYAGILTLLLVGLGTLFSRAFARQLDADATAELEEMTRAVHGYLHLQDGVPVLAYDRTDPEQVAFTHDATRYLQIYDADSGYRVVASDALASLGLRYAPRQIRAFVDQPRMLDVAADHVRLRLSDTVFAPAAGKRYLVQVGIRLDGRDTAVTRFRALLLWSLPAVIVLVLLTGHWMAGRALKPMARLASAARRIGVADLDRRLPVRGAQDELDRLAEAFNELVSRLGRAVQEMQQFSAAMAHEIRTPLAAIRADLELSLIDRRSPDAQRLATARQLERIDDLSRLLARLLLLARAEAGQLSVASDPLDLTELARSVVESIEPVALASGVELASECTGEVTIVGDRGWLERLLVNLLDNAIKYTPRGGRIGVSVTQQGSTAVLAVRDTGQGISADGLPHVFDRFYRADASRSPTHDGAGLGLTLAKWIAERHGATIAVSSLPDHGSTFTVTFRVNGVSSLGSSDRSAPRHAN